jgi:hypothetical protein
LAAVAREEQPEATGPLDQMFREFLATRSAPTRARARENARATLADPSARAGSFGRYAHIDPNEYRTLGSGGLVSRVGQLPLQAEAVEASIKKADARIRRQHVPTVAVPHLQLQPAVAIPNIDPPDPTPHLHFDADLVKGFAFNKLRLVIEEVHCYEETDEWGDDEISLGGTATTPLGKTSPIGQFVVSNDIEEGDTVTVSRVFCNWDLEKNQAGFPYVYAAVIMMAEKDDGGFYKFLKALWESVEAEVKKAVIGLVGAAIGAALGSTFGPLGTVVGVIVGYLVGGLIAWLISLFDNPDDIVGIKTLVMTLGSCKKSYYDWAKLTTSEGFRFTVKFKGDGGKYSMTGSYKVHV